MLDQLLSINSKNITRTDVFNVIGDIDEDDSNNVILAESKTVLTKNYKGEINPTNEE